ncbi:MAG: hypothetical protein ACC655_08105 [Rhodothermia bacterium]
MTRFLTNMLFVAFVLLVSACDQEETDRPLASIGDTAWILSKFVAENGTTSDPVGADFFVHFVSPDSINGVSFADGMIYNFFVLEYEETPGGEIFVGSGFVTERTEPIGSRLTEFLVALTSSRSYQATESTLRLEQEGGTVLVFRNENPEFPNTLN